LAVADYKGIQSDLIPKIATGFCSGTARTGGQCGALSGGIISLGLLKGRHEPGESIDHVYRDIQTLVRFFYEEFNSINCEELTGCHLGTTEGQNKFRETGQISFCLNYVEAVTLRVLELSESLD
jgi:C_GCAxxG_C_C family probable redox protein